MKPSCKTLMYLIFTIAFSIAINAQQDPEAKAILDKLSATFKSFNCIEASFVYSIVTQREELNFSTEGIFILKGDKYKLDVMGVETYFDGSTLWNYIIDANEVNITTPDSENQDFFLSHPKDIFTVYTSGYKYRYIGETIEEEITYQEIDLYPKDIENSHYSRYKILINKTKNQLHSVAAFAKNGNIYVVEIVEMITDNDYEDTFFVFDKENYPGVEIVDLRE